MKGSEQLDFQQDSKMLIARALLVLSAIGLCCYGERAGSGSFSCDVGCTVCKEKGCFIDLRNELTSASNLMRDPCADPITQPQGKDLIAGQFM